MGNLLPLGLVIDTTFINGQSLGIPIHVNEPKEFLPKLEEFCKTNHGAMAWITINYGGEDIRLFRKHFDGIIRDTNGRMVTLDEIFTK